MPGYFSGAEINATTEDTTKNSQHVADSLRGGGARSSQDRGPDLDTKSATSKNTATRNRSSSASVVRSPVRLLPTSGVVSCRVTWCGVPVDSFEICPRTGFPLTPGECLLSLPRGRPWRQCWLVLEIISTENLTQHPAMRQARNHADNVKFKRDESDGRGLTRGVGVRRGTGEALLAMSSGGDREHRRLGMVVVGWQVRRDGCCFWVAATS